jgi:hypothetical protein
VFDIIGLEYKSPEERNIWFVLIFRCKMLFFRKNI